MGRRDFWSAVYRRNSHAKYATPYAALIVQGAVSLVLVIINFVASGGVQEAFQTMLSLAVVLQLVPFLYVFAARLKFAFRESTVRGRYGREKLIFAGLSGFLTTTLGIALAFFPAKQITSVWKYEVKMVGFTLAFLGLAAFFFFVYGRLKTPFVAVGRNAAPVPAERSSTP